MDAQGVSENFREVSENFNSMKKNIEIIKKEPVRREAYTN